MTAKRWAIYSVSTGLFTGRHVLCKENEIGRNTPDGCAAIDGRYDHLSQRVDVKTGLVIDYQPPPPDDDHEWNDTTRRWQKRHDVAIAEAKEQRARDEIESLEAQQHRAVREALLALLPDGPEKQRLQDIEDAIAAERPAVLTPKG